MEDCGIRLSNYVNIIPLESGELPCLLCGNFKNSKGDVLPKKTFITLYNLKKHVMGVHDKHPDFFKYMGSVVTYVSEKYLSFSNEIKNNKMNFLESDKWKRVKKMLGINDKSDESLFYKRIGEAFGLVKHENPVVSSFEKSSQTETKKTDGVSKCCQTERFVQSENEILSAVRKMLKSDLQKFDFVKNILMEDEVSKLWNSIVLSCMSQKARFKVFNRGGASFSKSFMEQKDGEEYALVKEMLAVESEYLKTVVIAFVAVDNNDVKLPFALKKNHYHAMMQCCIFPVMTEDIPKSLNLTEMLSGKWKNEVRSSKAEEITEQYSQFSDNEVSTLSEIVEGYVQGLIDGSIFTMEPFVKKKVTKTFDVKRSEIVDRKSLLELFLKFLKLSKVVSRQVLDKRCASHEEFMVGFQHLIEMLSPKAGVITLSDQPGHEGTRKKKPSILVIMHIFKYMLSSSVTASWTLGFREFQKSYFLLNRDTRNCPHGYLKKIQNANHSYFAVILLYLMKFYIRENKEISSYSQLNVKEFVKVLRTKDSSFIDSSDHFADVSKIIWNEMSDYFWNVAMCPIMLKRSIRKKDWKLFSICRKLSLKLFWRANHTKYFKGVVEESFDIDYVWSKDVVDLYSNLFVLQSIWEKYSTYDEWYESENKIQKSGISTNPVSKLLYKSKFGNIIRFMKFVESEEINYGQEQLMEFDKLHRVGKEMDEFISKTIWSRVSCLGSNYLLPNGYRVIGQYQGGRFLVRSEYKTVVPFGIKKLEESVFKEDLKAIIESNCK